MTSSFAAAPDGDRFLHRVGDDLVAARAGLDLGFADDARRLELGFGEHRARFGLGGAALLDGDGARSGDGVGAALLEDACRLGVGVGPDRRGLVGRGGERRLPDPRGLGFGADQLELRGEPSLTQRGDGLASQPLDLLLRAATLAGVLLLRHRAPRLRTSARS